MSCTRVLHAFGSRPQPAVMPVDLAMCLSLSQQQPLYQLLSMSPLKHTPCDGLLADCPPRLSPHSSRHSSSSSSSSSLPASPLTSEPRSCFRRDSVGVNKKHVVFADAKGLALTAVRFLIPEHSSPSYTRVAAKLQRQQSMSNRPHRYKMRLGFPQPTMDIKAFLARLRETHVQLESCNITERTLSGRVCVSHVSSEKTVHIKVTFDSWRSHYDIPCMFLLQQRCAGSDMEVFSFDISMPQNVSPKERIAFCVVVRPGLGATPHWDNNRGQNYSVCMETDGSNASQADINHYRYPTFSKYQSAFWPSHVSLSMQNSADLQYLQRSLSSRVRTEWKSLCSSK
ncbi:Protein phosphatase 1 regulatory subunit 3C-B [Channa argus]|uniref:Protein phosphatase 1 regulatory subunit 3C-B n=1 Tax=Channa argus TaxID=215402 RepID=A0A6G1QI64_CHAAH|nr:Protein phosphatase 1 regulatory subunit 3C-B [Channa argus]KAK2888491.1 hypothetical protein Q8A73_019939 [Channa argus]